MPVICCSSSPASSSARRLTRAHGLALVHQPFEAMLGLSISGSSSSDCDLGQRQHAVGLAAQPLDDALDHRVAIPGRLLDLALAPHAALARRRQLGLGLPQCLVGFAQPGLADG